MSPGTDRWRSHWVLSNVNRIQQYYLVNNRRNRRRKHRMGYRTKYFTAGKLLVLDPQNRWWPTEILWACPWKKKIIAKDMRDHWSVKSTKSMEKCCFIMALMQISDQVRHWYCKNVVFSELFWNWIRFIKEPIWDFCIWQWFPLQ